MSNSIFRNKLVSRATMAAASILVAAGMLSASMLSAHADDFVKYNDLPSQTKAVIAGLRIGAGGGTLVDATSEPTPAMSDTNGAAAVDGAVPAGKVAITDADWYTTNYIPLNWFQNQPITASPSGDAAGTTIVQNYYVRVSVNRDPSNTAMRVQLMKNNDATPLEILNLTAAANTGQFTTFTTMWPQVSVGRRGVTTNTPISVKYDRSSADDNHYGTIYLRWGADNDGKPFEVNNAKIRTSLLSTTLYKTVDGTTLASYTVRAGSGQTATPSKVREFAGYKYVRTTTATDLQNYTIGTDFVDAQSASRHVKRIARIVNTNGDVVKSVWIDDPTYTGTRNYTDTSTTGFIKVLETSAMALGTVNTNTTLEANATTSTGQPFFNNTGSAATISATAALPTTGQADDEHNHVRAYGTDDAAGVANSPQVYLGFNGLNPPVATTFLTGVAKSLYVTYQTDPSQSATNVSVQLWNDVVRQTQTTHYYEPATGNVIVHYIDEEGNVIKNPVNDETNAPVNKQYDTEDKREQTITFNGSTYTYVKPKENNTTGKVLEGTTDVTYIYRKVVPQGNVVIHYIDEDGNVIKTQSTTKPTSQ